MIVSYDDSPSMEPEKSTKTIVECINVLFADPKLRYFFEVSLPMANERNETLGHTLLICSDPEIKECFITLLRLLKSNSNIHAATLLPELSPSDLGKIITNLGPDDILLIDNEKLNIEQQCIDIIKSAMENYYFDISIGKGPSARSIKIDHQHFTVVACIEKTSKALSSLIHQFDYVIKIDEENLPEICKARIKEECTHQITDESCDYIACRAKYDVRTSVKFLKKVLDYLKIKNIDTVITKDLVEEIFDVGGIGVTLKETADDERLNILTEIRNSLRGIQEDMHALRDEIEDFIAANGE